jgi:flagellin
LVNKQRADLGAYQNRLETAIKGLDIASENLSASESKIRDTDLAEKMVEYVKDQILEQTSLAFIAQANNQSQNVLTLLD